MKQLIKSRVKAISVFFNGVAAPRVNSTDTTLDTERSWWVPNGVSAFNTIYSKILLIAFVNIAVFAIFVSYTALDSYRRSAHLHDIQSRQYPIQENLVSALYNLKFIQSTLETAVVTGDEDLLLTLDNLQLDFSKNLDSTIELQDQDTYKLELLKSDFNKYYLSAGKLAVEMIDNMQNYQSFIERGRQNSQMYDNVLADLQRYKSEHDINFNSNVQSAARLAENSIKYLALFGIFSAGFVLIIAIGTADRVKGRITEMNHSLKDIAMDKGDINVRLSLDGSDEISELAFWFNSIIEKLNRLTERTTYEIKRIAYIDFLSGLPNRRWIMEFLEIESKKKYVEGSSLHLLILDLDNFKPINDQYGHEAGDEVIRYVAEVLNNIVAGESVSQVDIEHGRCRPVIGRIGGDEFMAVLPGTFSLNDVQAMCNLICTEITKPIQLKDAKCSVGVSIGISCFGDYTDDYNTLVDHADMAMYQAKKDGKNRFTFFNQDIESELTEQNNITSAIKNAINNDEFSVVYQPKYKTDNKEYIGSEALIRWSSDALGFVSPAVFIPIAEKGNLIIEIDKWMINAVCKQLRLWNDAGYIAKRIAINVSAEFIAHLSFADYLRTTASLHDVDLTSIEIEITETSALRNLDHVKSNIEKIRSSSVTVALDDFGAGHSSLQLLLNCQIDTLKIDKSLIDQVELSEKSLSLVKSLISMSKNFNLKSVAEGVETDSQLAILRKINCDITQGYLLARPMNPEDLMVWINNGKATEAKLAS